MGIIKLITIVLIILVILSVFWTLFPSFFETPKFRVLKKVKNFEIREYNATLAVSSAQEGSRDISLSKGFSVLARYIGGYSDEQIKVSMTVPVIQEKTMDNKYWKTLFFMPKKFSSTNAPNPLSENITIKKIPKIRVAVIKFNGSPSQDNLKKNGELLESWITDLGIGYDINKIRYAFYHGPVTPGFLRKNEVQIPLK